MQTIKNLFSYTAVLLGFAAFAFFAPSCSDSDDPVTPSDAPVTGIKITPEEITVTEGLSKSIVVSVLPSNAADKTYKLTSSDTSVATVEDDKITGVAPGEAIITATSNEGNFTATCKVTVKSTEPMIHSLNAFSQGALLFYGTNYGTEGLSHNWRIQLTGTGYKDAVNLMGKGDALMFEINTSTDYTTEVVPGTYTMLKKDETVTEALKPGTAIPGLIDGTDGESPIGTWYLFGESEDEVASAVNDIESGTVEVSKNGDEYTLKFDFLDEDENILFKGTYVGTLTYIDVTTQPRQ